jgi:hypothetical protein
MLRTLIVSATLAVAISPAAFAQDMKVEDAPAAVRAVALLAAGGLPLESVALDLDGGIATYEFKTKTERGTQLEIDVTADGHIDELEEEITINDVPGQVTELLARHFPGLKPTFIERSTRGSLAVWYEFEGTHDGRELDIEVRSDGRVILIQDDTAG